MQIAFFAHELADAAVHKRIAMLETAGCGVTLLGFARDRGQGAPQTAGAHVLGRTRNGRFLERLAAIGGALPRAWRLKPHWAGADVIIARNLEMLVLVRLLSISRRARIVYECLDIHRLALARGPVGALVRALERICLARTALIVTSSPAFERHYFRERQKHEGAVLVLENKVLAPASATIAAPPDGPPWRIAWCGVLRCRRSFDLLRALARAGDGRVLIDLWGAPALDQIPDFHEALAGSHHIAYRGRYAPNDLADIYARAHFAWAVDFYEAGGNSDWLLPNRLYESLAFGAVPIAAVGVETARWLQERGVGVVLEAPLEASTPAFFETLTPQRYAPLANAARGLDAAATHFTPEACRELARTLLGRAA